MTVWLVYGIHIIYHKQCLCTFFVHVYKSYICTKESFCTICTIDPYFKCGSSIYMCFVCFILYYLYTTLDKMVLSITVYRESEMKSSNYNKINMHACCWARISDFIYMYINVCMKFAEFKFSSIPCTLHASNILISACILDNKIW